MKDLAIIADDLSSATDCGIQVAKSGLRTLVPLAWHAIGSDAETVDVVSLDADSRSLPADQAYERVRRAAGLVVEAGFPSIYKSLDSTLRGNLGAEIDAVLDVFGVDLAVVAPAFPLYGRTTLGGTHFLNGKPINKTEFATDPQCPVNEANLVRLLSSQSRRTTGLVQLGTLREGTGAVARRLAALRAEKTELVIFDAQVETDLDRIARAVSATDFRVLWVGSTGLARCIPAALGVQAPDGPRPKHLSSTDRIMLVVGSASEITHNQLDHLEQRRQVVTVQMNPFIIIADANTARTEMERCRSQVVDALKGGSDVALHVASSRKDISAIQSLGHRLGLTPVEVSACIVDALSRITRRVADAHELRGIVLTGGDTAKAVCARLGATGIRIWEEVEPGIPLGRLAGEREMLIVTKAGAFGTPQALIRALEALQQDV
ncbi:MAG: four-carbon acid sugar kinase family protein [Anaerolineae bacterium]|jgi:uncharacterized protein YgbK (DUF1537 family)